LSRRGCNAIGKQGVFIMTIARIGPEFLVNNTTLSDQFSSVIATLPDGRFIVTWTDYSFTGGDTSNFAVRARIFNADGSEALSEFIVSTTTLGLQGSSKVAVLPDGRFIMTWTDNSQTGSDDFYGIRARIFNPDGTESVPEFEVNTTTISIQEVSNVAVLADGRFVVSWTDYSAASGDNSGTAIRARIFNPDGTESVPEFLVNTTPFDDQAGSSIAVLADGRFVVTWLDASRFGGDTSSFAIRARIFNPDGTQSVPEFLVNTTTLGAQNESSIAVLSDGRFVVTWTDASASGGDISGWAIRARIFNADGTQSVPEFLVNTTTTNSQYDSSIAILADGRFVVSWTDESATGGDTSQGAIRARIFNADGTQSVPEFLVNTTTTSDQRESSIAVLADGRFVVTWRDNSADDGDIRSQIFDPTIFDGTAAGEVVTGGNFDDRYYGYGGNDTMSGRAGDDYLNGGDGDDILNGEDGDDRLDGGNNGDVLNGGAGDDQLFGRAGLDILNGGDGADNLYGGLGADQHIGGNDAGIDLARYDDANYGNLTIRLDNAALNVGLAAAGDLYTGIEGLVGGLGNDTIFGNTAVNYLYGSVGNDILNGLAGTDYLYGGLGNDKYYVDNAGDFISELAGGGTADRVYASVSYVLGAGQQIEILTTTSNAGVGTINLKGNEFNQTIQGNAGSNILNGAGGADIMSGFGGNDRYYVDNIGDIVNEAAGDGTADRVLTSVSYALGVGQQIEFFSVTVSASTGAISLTGNQFNQTIQGNAGANVINGGAGNDILFGFGGVDSFVFNTALNTATNHDTISDYNVADDTIRLENAIFTLLTTTGTLGANQFKNLSLGAQDAGDRIIYNQTSGELFYDTNGLTAGGMFLFADVTDGLILTNLDIFVI
jgi:Ca2+-binding RTX toxin-like protein